MSSTFAYEDPLNRASTQLANQGTKAQTIFIFKEMGRNIWSQGRGFAKVGALYAGTECCIEGVSFVLLRYNNESRFPISKLLSISLTAPIP